MSASSRKKLAVARFWYEGNAFSPVPCRFEDFRLKEWSQGEAALQAARGTATELGAVEAFARAHPDWEVTVLRCASAMPAGPMDDEVFKAVKEDIVAGLSGGTWDAVYLSLHGACITQTNDAPDIELLQAVRQCVPGVPIGASFDLHANLGERHAALLDMAAGYRTYPHIDMDETAGRVLEGLRRIVSDKIRTAVHIAKPGLILPSFNMRTAQGPMRTLQALAVAGIGDAVLDVAVFGGFPYADSADTGACVLVVEDVGKDPDGRQRQRVLNALLAALHQHADAFEVVLPTPQQAIVRALDIIRQDGGRVAITDPADNPLSGGTNDTPALLRALLQSPHLPATLFACFTAPDVVRQAHQNGVGATLETTLGARHSNQFGEPVPLALTTELLTDGEFINVGPMEKGVISRCGKTALMSVAGRPQIRIIVTEAVAPTHDPGLLALHGLDLSQLQLLCVKAKNHFRAAFEAQCQVIIDIDAPGPAALNLQLLPFRKAPISRAGAAPIKHQ